MTRNHRVHSNVHDIITQDFDKLDFIIVLLTKLVRPVRKTIFYFRNTKKYESTQKSSKTTKKKLKVFDDFFLKTESKNLNRNYRGIVRKTKKGFGKTILSVLPIYIFCVFGQFTKITYFCNLA